MINTCESAQFQLASTRLGPHLLNMHWHADAVVGSLARWCPPIAGQALLLVDVHCRPGVAYEHMHFGKFSAQQCHVTSRYGSADIDFCAGRAQFSTNRITDVRRNCNALALSLMVLFGATAACHGGLALHGATIVVDGLAHIIIGPSGAGKSTLAQRFAGQFLHDDVSLLVRTPGWQVWRQSAYRAPQGELAWQVPIAAVYCLESDRTCTRADRIAPAEACARVAMQTIFVGGAAAPAMAAALAALTQDVPVFGLSHALTDSVATVLRVFRNAAGARQDG